MLSGKLQRHEMSSNFWFLDREHKQCGPVGEDEFVKLIRAGTIGRETQIWSAGMSEWRMAFQVERFSSLFGPSGPPSVPVGGASSALPTGALSSSISVWGLFGRALLVMIGVLLVVPAPWTSTSFYKWLCERVSLPDGRGLTFAGKPGDIWYVFVAWGASIWAGQLHYGELITIPLSWILGILLLKWFCANVSTQDGHLKLAFEGGYGPYIGWNVLLILSALTIIGWAWVMKLMMQWICRNVRGTAQFEFTATGLSILWRTLVLVLLSILVIPIPWMMQWYTRWIISQVSVVSASAGVPSR
jgi:hypothetical protein